MDGNRLLQQETDLFGQPIRSLGKAPSPPAPEQAKPKESKEVPVTPYYIIKESKTVTWIMNV